MNFRRKSEAHLIAVRLATTARDLNRLKGTLSPDELRRMARFRFRKHQDTFAISRGLLRFVLCSYLGIPPKRLIFQYDANGKPTLQLNSEIHFNLAHSENCAVYALSSDTELGVDVEFIRSMSDASSIAKHFFAQGEYSDFLSIQQNKQTEAFYACWTRKEAYLKLSGQGLSTSLKRFRVSLIPGQPPSLLSVEGNDTNVSELKFFHLVPFQGYVGALAIRSQRCALREWCFENTTECLAFLETNNVG